MYVCLCHGVSDKKIRKLAIDEGVTDIRGIKRCTALGSQCGKCIKQAKEILAETHYT
ncbi:bacterioferritin, partial [Vibrio parahaemolyticus]